MAQEFKFTDSVSLTRAIEANRRYQAPALPTRLVVATRVGFLVSRIGEVREIACTWRRVLSVVRLGMRAGCCRACVSE